jgi:hypothetical protein
MFTMDVRQLGTDEAGDPIMAAVAVPVMVADSTPARRDRDGVLRLINVTSVLNP